MPFAYDRCRPAIEAAVDEHRGALQDREAGGEGVKVVPKSAAVIELGRLPTIQLAYDVGPAEMALELAETVSAGSKEAHVILR